MATIVPTYAYTDGAALNISGHNTNLYSVTDGEGVYSEANGGIQAANLDAAFAIQDYHVWPEEAVRVRGDNNRQTVDYFSAVETGADVADGNVREEMVNVAGCGLRFYLPYRADVLMTAGFFVSVWRPHAAGSENDGINIDLGDIRLQMTIDLPAGSAGSSGVVNHTKRGLPVSVRVNVATGIVTQVEDVACFYFNLHHFERNVTAGFVDFHLRLLVKQPPGDLTYSVVTPIPADTTGARSVSYSHNFYNRVTFGIRNPCALILGS